MPSRHRAPEYEAFKEELRAHLMDILFESVPQVKGKIDFYHLGTPLSEITWLHSFHVFVDPDGSIDRYYLLLWTHCHALLGFQTNPISHFCR